MVSCLFSLIPKAAARPRRPGRLVACLPPLLQVKVNGFFAKENGKGQVQVRVRQWSICWQLQALPAGIGGAWLLAEQVARVRPAPAAGAAPRGPRNSCACAARPRALLSTWPSAQHAR